ncbi:hypothetical protein [Ralstonia sp. ASV6]|uniref:hypothetical protein n=1 Tax=Ralstonia sp. ASV6 TaxID=2795124 RepID=UPI0018EB451D|nr:hypothetical protein [Ralstonia sp. ASV6]
MNGNDAMRLAEDMAVLRGSRGPVAVPEPSSDSSAAFAVALGMRAVKVHTDANVKLKGQFDQLSADYSDLSAVCLASRKVIDMLAAQLAQAQGLKPAEVKASVYKMLSREYDSQVGDMLSIGVLNEDPRRDPAVLSRPSRDWYTPGA